MDSNTATSAGPFTFWKGRFLHAPKTVNVAGGGQEGEAFSINWTAVGKVDFINGSEATSANALRHYCISVKKKNAADIFCM